LIDDLAWGGDIGFPGVAIFGTGVSDTLGYLTLARNDIQASRAPLALERDQGTALQWAPALELIA
jgi:hypothetical protein